VTGKRSLPAPRALSQRPFFDKNPHQPNTTFFLLLQAPEPVAAPAAAVPAAAAAEAPPPAPAAPAPAAPAAPAAPNLDEIKARAAAIAAKAISDLEAGAGAGGQRDFSREGQAAVGAVHVDSPWPIYLRIESAPGFKP
jgi:hypothetical protein